ncbi:uncharacterized protein LOC132703387 [Cylas formicarius]|uniref:uncharacterized protein LOC132703387 n=1 Tax=Cylas formicarius TaxID=197179 RepID=UPI0029583DC4|nr:uncharacterized protein LOC132703387 [Cylas formicarius]
MWPFRARTYTYPSEHINGDTFLIKTAGCTIGRMDPFANDILPYLSEPEPIRCDGEVQTYVTKIHGHVYLNVNSTAIRNSSLLCCYAGIYRNLSAAIPDDNIFYSECVPFVNRIPIEKNTSSLRVTCENGYDNVHYVFHEPPPDAVKHAKRPNVLMIGIDALSRLNFIRTMPKTVEFCQRNGWIDLKGYNKILHNTYPNMMAAMTGKDPNASMSIGNAKNTFPFEDIDFIWKHFKSRGYTTAYAEDWPLVSTFNFVGPGFLRPPTDYYPRAYFVAQSTLPEKVFCGLPQCYGPQHVGLGMIKLIEDFTSAIKNRAGGFGLFWSNSFSHSDLNCPKNLDKPYLRLFERLKRNGVLRDTVVIFFSDHGFRFGEIVETTTGWLENRLPFLYIWLPSAFRTRHPKQYRNLVANARALTSPYDLHMTLKHILALHDPTYSMLPSPGCADCKSLLEEINPARTCSDAGIPPYWCSCSKYIAMPTDDIVATRAAVFCVDDINRSVEGTNCSQYTLGRTLEAKYFEVADSTIANMFVRVLTVPPAKFEVNLRAGYDERVGELEFSTISVDRLDRYEPVAWCSPTKDMRRYCHCGAVN